MATKFFTSINMNNNAVTNVALNPQGSTPSSTTAGLVYFDTNSSNTTTYNRFVVRKSDDSGWVSIPYSGSIVNADISSSAAITVTKLLTSGSNAVTISSIGAPTGSVSFNSQAITGVSTLSTSGDITVGGDLNVTGAINETTVNDLNVKDLTITVADGSADKTAANNAGITVDLGTDGTAKFYYTSSGNRFNFDKDTNLVSGKVYQINGSEVLSSTAVLGKTPGGSGAGDIVTIDGSQILTNKTIGVSQLSGTISIANGGTGTGTTSQNYVFAGPASGGAGAPSFRVLTSGDLPSITSVGTITSGTWNGTKIDIPYGGTNATTAAGARQNLGATGYYSSATHSSGTQITITAATHGLNTSGIFVVQVFEVATGDVVYPDININTSTGTVTVTFATSQSANTYRVTIIGQS